MGILRHAAVAAAGLALASGAAAFGQLPELAGKSDDKAFGYVDLKTGIFHKMMPEVAASPDLLPVTPAAVTGTFEFTFDVAIASTFPTGTVIYCETTIAAESEFPGSTTTLPYTSNYGEIGVGHVAAGGKGVTCNVTIPYSWEVAPTTLKPTNIFTASYSVYAILPSSTATGSILINTAVLRETTSVLFAQGLIPTSGTISKKTVSVTL